jgi:hypothetical protein
MVHLTLVAHAYNPTFSGGRDQKDSSPKPVQANSSQDLILKKPFIKRGWWSVVFGFKPQQCKIEICGLKLNNGFYITT